MDLLKEISPQVIVSLVSVVVTGLVALLGTVVSNRAEKRKFRAISKYCE